jgi:D-hydroxyproline dehydrogenase subunit alpha
MEREQVVVVGAGVAGTAAAVEAARLGLGVTLVDEHPLDPATMALDTPYFFGPRLPPSLADRDRMRERVLETSDPLQRAVAAGARVRLGTCVWGAFGPGENSTRLAAPCVGLADSSRSWLTEYGALIIAAGGRDLALAFPGWELPGVLGAQGAMALLTRYQALDARRLVIVGAGALGLRVAGAALEHGIDVVGFVDVAARVPGPAELWAPLAARGVPFFGAHVVQAVEGDTEVAGIRLTSVAGGRPVTRLACDTVCLAVGLVPNVELPSLAGCRLSYQGQRGGWVPDRDTNLETSRARVYVAGDAGGVDAAMVGDPAIAASQGRLAAVAAAEALDVLPSERARAIKHDLASGAVAPATVADGDGFQAWARALVAAGGLDVVVCPCEGVTRRELLDVAPPRYLDWAPPRAWPSKLATVTPERAAAHPDLLKRLTRVGMGHCQGRRCREQVALLLADGAGIDAAAVPLASYRAPVRPLPMRVLGADDEPESVRAKWAGWFSPWYKVHG